VHVTDQVLYEIPEPGVALLTLNRPEALNAWTPEMGLLLRDLLDQCAADPEVKAIVITGAGRGFCSGADLGVLSNITGADGASRSELGTLPMYHTLQIPKPVIAAINGPCAGMGVAQVLMCDIRFAAAGAKIAMAFSQRGLIAEWGLSWTLPRIVGSGRALDLLLSSRILLAEEAASMGLVNAVLPPDELLPHAIAYASNLARTVSPTSMMVMKRQVYGDWERGLVAAHDEAVRLMLESFGRPDLAEGVASFLEKRPPVFPSLDPDA